MKGKTYLYILILTAALAGCKTPQKQPPVTIEKSHPVYITGVVKSLESINVDKSGKNPRFILHFIFKITRYDDGGWDTILGPEIKCVIKEEDLLKQTGLKLKPGDSVLITAHITEKSPKVIAVYAIEFLSQEQIEGK
jgi:predicted component of type VI protein secretion system